jgi:hypothetical protein
MAIASFCTLPPIKESLKSGRLRGHDFVKSKAKKLLLDFADELGCKIQYHCPGFLKSKRQVGKLVSYYFFVYLKLISAS